MEPGITSIGRYALFIELTNTREMYLILQPAEL